MTRPSDNQEAVGRFVRNEVSANVAGLVSTLASGYGCIDRSAATDLVDLTEQAFELACPVPDYEEAARDEGWMAEKEHNGEDDGVRSADGENWCETWEDACRQDDIEPYDRGVYEHWIVSSYLADKLEAHGEKVDRDFAGLIVWARTTTGQAILLDGVICDIFDELHNPKLEV